MDKFDDLQVKLEMDEKFKLQLVNTGNSGSITVIARDGDQKPFMKIGVNYSPFSIAVFDCSKGREIQVWKTANSAIFFTPNGDKDFAIVQSVSKPQRQNISASANREPNAVQEQCPGELFQFR
jgi:alpha-glucosidase